jgi:hypothetical protein
MGFWDIEIGKLDFFPSSDKGRETHNLLSPLGKLTSISGPADLSSFCGTKQIQFTKRCFLVFRIPDDGRSPRIQWC